MAVLPGSDKPLRIIAWPAFNNQTQNPYNALLYANIAKLGARVEDFSPCRLIFGRHDIWHLHWPEAVLGLPQPWKALPLAFILRMLLRIARAKDTKIVWTVHNLRSHEGLYPRIEASLWEALIARLDGYIALTETGRTLAVSRHPSLGRRPGFVIPHGDYRAAYTATMTLQEARAKLGLPARGRVLVSIGQLRPYKNVPHLIEQFRALDAPDTTLLIAGQPVTPAIADEILAAAGDDARVRVHFGFVPADELQIYLRATDLVVLPYEQILNSGSAILALSFARPVLVPDQGVMAELRRAVGAEWVRTYAGELRSTTLGAALEWAMATPRAEHGLVWTDSWDAIAQQTLDAYRAIVAQAAPTARGE